MSFFSKSVERRQIVSKETLADLSSDHRDDMDGFVVQSHATVSMLLACAEK